MSQIDQSLSVRRPTVSDLSHSRQDLAMSERDAGRWPSTYSRERAKVQALTHEKH